MPIRVAGLMLLLAMLRASSGTSAGGALIGRPAPPLGLSQWLNSPPLETQDLQGKVALIRWWTDGCPLCSTTAPALRLLQGKFAARGLQVIGIFHPKPPGDQSLERVRLAGRRLGLPFPLALDADWKALGRWWLDQQPRDFTSVTFLLDKRGIIRYVHRGGEFHQDSGGSHRADHRSCLRDYKEIEQTIEKLLAE